MSSTAGCRIHGVVALVVGASLVTPPSAARATPPRECTEDAHCVSRCTDVVAELVQPAEVPAAFTGATCMTLGVACAEGCSCDDASPSLGCACERGAGSFVFVTADRPEEDCQFWGRAHECLYARSEFPGCEPQVQDGSCAAVCAELQARIEADALETKEVTLHGAVCTDGYLCSCVVNVGGACFSELSNLAHDCAQSAREIWKADERRAAAAECDGSPGGCAAAPSRSVPLGLGLGLLMLLGRRSGRAGGEPERPQGCPRPGDDIRSPRVWGFIRSPRRLPGR